jgi:hypothetical protein
VDQSVLPQIVRGAQCWPGFQQARAARRKHLVLQQQLDIQTGIMSGAVTDREIEIAAGQIDDLVAGRDAHVHRRKFLLKPVQPQHQPFRDKGRRRGDRQRAGLVMRPQPAHRGVDAGERLR